MQKEKQKKRVMLDAHRGNSRYFPENTIPSFESAMRLEIDMIETDVHMTKDGELIVMHDDKVDRTTDGTGFIFDHTLAEIKELDAGSWKSDEFKGTRVPAFAEFLELARTRRDLTYIIEFKDYPAAQGDRAFACCDNAIAMIEQYGMGENVILNSFSGELLEYVEEKYRHKYRQEGYFPLSCMGDSFTKDPYSYLYSMCLFDKEKIVADKKYFDMIASKGIEPWVYYPNEDPEIYRLAVERGAVGLTANDPQKAHEILKELGVR